MPPKEYWAKMTQGMSIQEINKMYENYDLPKDFYNIEYREFLEERRKLMARRIRKYFEIL